MEQRRYRWWHGLAFYAGVQAASLALKWAASRHPKADGAADRRFYENTRLPVFAPPGALFPVAWGVNSVAAIAGGLYVFNLPRETVGRVEFLRRQAAAWVLFSLFSAAYFGLRSPINAALVTFLYSAATAASVDTALRKMHNPAVALSLAPTAAWLTIANPLGVTQALWNRDPFWHAGPFLEPDPRWLKEKTIPAAH